MLALAAALDPEFFETAKEAGESWLEGFREGTDGWEGLLNNLVVAAQSIIDTWLENLPSMPTEPDKTPHDYPSDIEWGGYAYKDKIQVSHVTLPICVKWKRRRKHIRIFVLCRWVCLLWAQMERYTTFSLTTSGAALAADGKKTV